LSLFTGIRYFFLTEKSKHKTLKRILGFIPGNIELYEQAFRHKSAADDDPRGNKNSNERLEFLGDAILDAIIADYFFLKFPFKGEGFLTKMRSRMVSRSFLNDLAKKLDLDTFLEISEGVKNAKSVYGNALEALIGAIYLDKGYELTKRFVIERIIAEYIDIEALIALESDFKSKLIIAAQKAKKTLNFSIKLIENEEFNYYIATIVIEQIPIIDGKGNSKKAAEQDAAQLFFERGFKI
jgi:ribonuclease-3